MDRSDEKIFSAVQKGDNEAFGHLIKRYQARLYTIALRVLQHPEDAQDAVQQAFLQVWRRRDAYNPRWRLSAWLYRIVTNICIDEYRRRKRQRMASDAIRDDNVSEYDPPDKSYEKLERRAALYEALDRLSLEDRIILILCYMKGMSYSEAAEVRGISVNTLKKRLQRAKKSLFRHLT